MVAAPANVVLRVVLGLLIVLAHASAADDLTAIPAWQRCDVPGGATTTASIALRAVRDAAILAVETDCACVATTAKLPLALPAGVPTSVGLRVVGIRPGVKTVTVRTTLGTVVATLQVVTAGLGQGADLLATTITLATARHERLIVIAHDLGGAERGCGCSTGALGGIERLAAMPGAVRARAPELACSYALTGDADGRDHGVAEALAAYGWARDASIVVAADAPGAAAALGDARTTVVVATGDAPNHRRVVRPLLDHGLTVEVVAIDAAGQVARHDTIPIDATLPSEPAILAAFPAGRAVEVRAATAAGRCAACHADAHAVWGGSPHARAWLRLGEPDRVDACIGCHTTRVDGADDVDRERPVGPRVQDVRCEACHRGAVEHAADPRIRTTGVTDCRSCHDARRHPAFRDELWEVVRHGR